MRITPTQEQITYLTSIGTSRAAPLQPVPATEHPPKANHSTVANSSTRAGQWWAILLVILAFLFAVGALVRAGELPAMRQSVTAPVVPARSDANQLSNWGLRGLNAAPGLSRESPSSQTMQGELVELQKSVTTLKSQLGDLRATLQKEESTSHKALSDQVQNIQADLQNLKRSSADRFGALTASIPDTVDARVAELVTPIRQAAREDSYTLSEALNQQRQDSNRRMIWFAVVCILLTGLIATGMVLLRRRISQVEQDVVSELGERLYTGQNIGPVSNPPENADGILRKSEGKTIGIGPVRPLQKAAPDPLRQMQKLIKAADALHHIRVKPAIPSSPWRLGLATAKGNVRSENQDYGLHFTIGDHDVLIVADGCGGLPYGQRAAHLAAAGAAESIIHAYGAAPRGRAPRVKDTAVRAILQAGHRLSIEGDKLNVADAALRTTLIVVIGDKREIGYAYIGDGGGYLIRSSGEVCRFLEPQKASDLGMNVLAASLGPVIEGEPLVGVLSRSPGDVLIVGTDGVFDRVDETFPKKVLGGCIECKGDLQAATAQVVAELADFKDSLGFVCDDNLTLGVMGDGTCPKVSEGFWLPAKEAAEANIDTPLELAASELKG